MTLKDWFLSKLKRAKWIEMALCLLCILVILGFQFINIPLLNNIVSELNGRIYDQMIHWNWRIPQPAVKVVVIDINEQSVQKEGRWPWPRDKMAELLTKLKQQGVVTIGLDIVMSEPETNYALGLKAKLNQLVNQPDEKEAALLVELDKLANRVDNDKQFSLALLDHTVVPGFLFHNNELVKTGELPKPLLDTTEHFINAASLSIHQFQGYNGALKQFIQAAGQAGFVTNLPDNDGTFRHAFVIADYNKYVYPSLSLAVAMNYLLVDRVQLVKDNGLLRGIKLGGIFIPTNSLGQILIPFWGKAGTLDYYSAADILQNKIDTKELAGSIAIIGSSMALLADIHQTPVALLFPGVEMVANMVQGIVGQQLISEYDWHTPIAGLYLFLLGVFFAIIFSFFDIVVPLILSVIAIVAILTTALLLFVYERFYIPIALLIMLISLQVFISTTYSFIREKKQKRKISNLFGQYVPREYVNELIESSEEYNMEGQTRNMTAQFIDIRDFTSVCETLDAQGVKSLLNSFFTPLTEIIFSQRGTIDKYVGDMIMAFWGAPREDSAHAYHAIVSALTIFKQLPTINAQLKTKNLPSVNIGIGLATGLMNVGDMGSEFRRAYTVLGDTVNLASRLQDLTKFYQVDILVSDITYSEQTDFFWRVIDKVTVKGRTQPLTIYQPLDMVIAVSAELRAEVEEYNSALASYYAQDWQNAEKKFAALSECYPEIYLYRLYYKRVLLFKHMPPEQPWDGVYKHTEK